MAKKEPVCRACGHIHHPPGRFTEVGFCDGGVLVGAKPCGCGSCRCLPCIKSIKDPKQRKIELWVYPNDTDGAVWL